MKTITSLAQFKTEMLAAEANGAIDKIEVPAQKPAKKIFVNGKFYPKSQGGKDAHWEPREIYKYLRDDYMKYMVTAYNQWAELKNTVAALIGVDEVSRAFGLEYNELRIDCPQDWGGAIVPSQGQEEKLFGYAARVFGFLSAVKGQGELSEFPALQAVKDRLRGRGYNSPAYKMSVLQLAKRSGCWNPGKLNRAIFAAQEAAYKKHGIKISLFVAARAVAKAGVKANGKAATIAYAISLGWDEYGSYSKARDFVISVILAKRKAEKGELYFIETPAPCGGRAQVAKILLKKNGWAWEIQQSHLFYNEQEWQKAEWELPLEQKIPENTSSGDEKLILENRALVIYQSERVGGQKVVDVKKTLANIAKFNKAKEIELEGVNLKVLREFSRAGYKFQFGWTQKIDRARPRVLSVEEPATGEIYQVSSYQGETIERALESATIAFQKRAAAKVMQQEVKKVVDPDEGVLVYLQDSYAVGNCQSGTAVWMERVGLAGSVVVPLWKIHEAAEKSDNGLAHNVVKHVVAEYLKQKEVA